VHARLAILLVTIGCTPVDPPVVVEATPPTPPSSPTLTCLARYALGQQSVLDEQRSRGGAQRWDDFAKGYPAATIDPATHHAVEVVADYRVADTPLLWFTPDFAAAVVDVAMLGDLQIVDATRLGIDERIEIGTVTAAGRAGLRGRRLAEFLLKSDAIQTYVHIGSTLCLIAEVDDANRYRAEFTGEHEYYTNEENHDPLAFSLEIAGDGRIVITGVKPSPLPPAQPAIVGGPDEP
jgi:hypothetical protein